VPTGVVPWSTIHAGLNLGALPTALTSKWLHPFISRSFYDVLASLESHDSHRAFGSRFEGTPMRTSLPALGQQISRQRIGTHIPLVAFPLRLAGTDPQSSPGHEFPEAVLAIVREPGPSQEPLPAP